MSSLINGKYNHGEEETPETAEIRAQIEGNRIVVKNCGKEADRVIYKAKNYQQVSPTYPALARRHPELQDGAYCSAITEEQVRLVGSTSQLCPYLGKPLGKTNTGRSIRPVRACNRAADMGDYHVLGNIPVEMALPKLSKKSLEDLQKIQKPKPSFWKKLFA